jgi:hypothetical protein
MHRVDLYMRHVRIFNHIHYIILNYLQVNRI